MPKSSWRKYINRMRKKGPNYTLYGIIAGVVALLAIATFVYPRYDRVQNFFRGRNNSGLDRYIASSRSRKSSVSTSRSKPKTEKDLRVENQILEAGRSRTDNL